MDKGNRQVVHCMRLDESIHWSGGDGAAQDLQSLEGQVGSPDRLRRFDNCESCRGLNTQCDLLSGLDLMPWGRNDSYSFETVLRCLWKICESKVGRMSRLSEWERRLGHSQMGRYSGESDFERDDVMPWKGIGPESSSRDLCAYV